MCLERLQQAIDARFKQNQWTGIKICKDGPLITNLFFADDMVLFGEASVQQAEIIIRVLQGFCKVSGEKVSIPKSRVFFSRNTPLATREAICNTLQFEETKDLGTYLGVPTINGRVTRQTFAGLEEKLHKKLAGWSMKQLSMAGRHTLVQSTLSTITNYTMQSSKIPRSICDDIDRKSRKYLWGGTEEKRTTHLLSWEAIQKPREFGGLSIVSARQANSAFLAKLGWRVLAEPNKLWARVLRSKYCKGRCDLNMFQAKANQSNVWNGIVLQREIIEAGSAISIGNGRNTLFWVHPWLSGECLSDKALSPIPHFKLQDTVSNMWTSEYGWRWEEFTEYLSPDVLKRISSYSVSEDVNLIDTIYWKGSSSGKFTRRSALSLIKGLDPNDVPDTPIWRIIWRLPVQQKVRMFIWLVAHDRLMTNYNRVVRHLGEDATCPRCSSSDEDLDHLLRSCPMSRYIWEQIGGPGRINSFFTTPIKEWLETNASNNSPLARSDWAHEFSITCWWIWKWRNNEVFGRGDENPLDVYTFLVHQFAASKRAFDRYSILMPQKGEGGREVYIRWISPPQGWVKLNKDGASKGNPGNAGSGGIFRDETGNYLSAFYTSIGFSTSMRAELYALLVGLKEANMHRFKKVIFELDNKTCIQLVQQEESICNELRGLMEQCKDLIRRANGGFVLQHCYREGNRAADWLANKGVEENHIVKTLINPPEEFCNILRDDVTGVSFPRLLNPL